ncbi:protein SON [Kryptolebias marmoratus]|uniref:Protein SON-like n=1 Tax=Kryptolebias marmoratus TaxID=37003 RepID=A0A3Q3AIG3_KRYMA|nr:protein SON [Kryptolebias marmoratus]
MAANLEQIFQDFILKKIREIEDQKEEKSCANPDVKQEPHETGQKCPDKDKRDTLRDSSSQKRQRKHKKQKSKKKKKNRDKESSSDSGSDLEGEIKYQQRRGTPKSEKKDQGEDHDTKSRCHKEHSSKKKKKKKKKKRQKSGENSSDSDSDFALKHRDDGCGQSLRRQEELPDIIPKQDSSNKDKISEKRHERMSPCSFSHSCSEQRNSPSTSAPFHRRCRSRTRSSPQCHRTNSSSSEKREDLDHSIWSNQCPSQDLQPLLLSASSTQTQIQLGEMTGSRATELQKRDSAEIKEDRAEQRDSGTSQSTLNQLKPMEPEQTLEPNVSERKASDRTRSRDKSPSGRKRRLSKSPQRNKEQKSSKKQKRSKSPHRSYRKRSRSRSHSVRKRSRSRSTVRRSRRSCSRSGSRNRRRAAYSQRDRWKREPSHSPVLILRKKRSPSRKDRSRSRSPHRISELDKEQLLEIAKANAAAMCVKAGMPVPASLRSTVLPLALPSMAMNAAMASMTAASVTAALSNMGTLSSLLPLPSISNKPPPVSVQNSSAALEEVKKKVAKQANSISIKEFTDKCKMIVDSTGELPVALPHVSDEEDDGKVFGGAAAIREQKFISFNINNSTVRPSGRCDADMAKEFPVSSGSQHRKKEGDGLGAYGEWVPVEKTTEKASVGSKKSSAPTVTLPSVPPGDLAVSSGLPDVIEEPTETTESDSVFPETRLQPVDISQAVTERIKAQRRLAENPYDISAMCMLSRAQEQVDAWAQSSNVPGLFTGSTGAQVLSTEELSTSGPQAWLKKDQFLKAAPVSGGVGEFLMRKMGWRTGEGLGRNREGTVEPIVIDFKVDRKGLVAEGEKPQKQTGGLVVTKDLMGKHPVSALIELCNKKRIMQPDFVMVHHSGPDHRKNFLFKVTVNGVDYQPQTPSPNKKHAKAMAATVALQALGEVPADGPGLYTGPVFTAASTGPLFST